MSLASLKLATVVLNTRNISKSQSNTSKTSTEKNLNNGTLRNSNGNQMVFEFHSSTKRGAKHEIRVMKKWILYNKLRVNFRQNKSSHLLNANICIACLLKEITTVRLTRLMFEFA